MIYSRRHKLNGVAPIDVTNWAPIHLVQPNFWTMPSEEETAAKLKAIGINENFLKVDVWIDFDHLRRVEQELNELRADYEEFFPETTE